LLQQPISVNDRVEEVLMRKQLLAGAMAVALATGMTTSAMAFGRGGGGFHGGGGGFHGGMGGFHGGGFRGSFGAMHGGNFAGMRGFSGRGFHGGWGGRRFVGGYGHGGYGYGPYYDDGYYDGLGLVGLGLGLATGAGYCSPYAYNYGYCGPGLVVGW
jgi:hypothetical protein